MRFLFLLLILLSSCAHKAAENSADPPVPVSEAPPAKGRSEYGFFYISEGVDTHWIEHSHSGMQDFKGESSSGFSLEGIFGNREGKGYGVIGVSHHQFTDKYKQLRFGGENTYLGLRYKAAELYRNFYFYPGASLRFGRYEVEDRVTLFKDTFVYSGIEGVVGIIWTPEKGIPVLKLEYFYVLGDQYRAYGSRVGIGMGF